jgi:hypothetical protein
LAAFTVQWNIGGWTAGFGVTGVVRSGASANDDRSRGNERHGRIPVQNEWMECGSEYGYGEDQRSIDSVARQTKW